MQTVKRGCRKLHNEELHNSYASPNIIYGDQVKENDMGAACSAHGRLEMYTEFCSENLKGRDQLRDLRIIAGE
jgi:hypothetical protein